MTTEIDVASGREVRLIHTSDIHLEDSRRGSGELPGNLHVLQAVLHTAKTLNGDIVLIVGDFFDHNRVSQDLLDGAVHLLSQSEVPVVVLPGNHDCLEPNSLYYRGDFASLSTTRILGMGDDCVARFPDLDLEVWGQPHLGYDDMTPLNTVRPRTTRWQVAMAHGHWVTHMADTHRSYLIHPEQALATEADYIALGHWDHWVHVGQDSVPAYYSGAPTFARTVNLVRFQDPAPMVSREPVVYPDNER